MKHYEKYKKVLIYTFLLSVSTRLGQILEFFLLKTRKEGVTLVRAQERDKSNEARLCHRLFKTLHMCAIKRGVTQGYPLSCKLFGSIMA